MNSGYKLTIKRLCFLLSSFVILTIQTTEALESLQNKQKSHAALEESRDKRNAEIDLSPEDSVRTKRYIPYEELQKRLRHFIGKRVDDYQTASDILPSAEKRMRYFVGKRADGDQTDVLDDNNEIAKRMRYFVGKRSRLRYFVGKRDGDETGPLQDEDLEKRMRYFVGKRRYFLGKRRYFLGKRDDIEENDPNDQVEKRSRLRYFVGKRPSDDFINGNAFHKRMRYFVGKRDQDKEQINDVEKRMRYFVGKRNNSEDSEQYEKRHMRYFVG
ncbi:unnamed protein product [Mytilus coruscus]|uniref:Uncharacterized protein n=1 Tax=Mytilus coruscus TaxID=42192 RepID=A0A6J8E5W1_MYTCO|nr:unnamed protein product [Mytilus coruscus]